MKKLLNIVLAVVSFFAAVSCVQELNTGIPEDVVAGEKVQMTFSASIGDDTKAMLMDGTDIWWEPGDMILINGDPFYATTNVPSKTTDFVGETVPADEYYALFSKGVGEVQWNNGFYELCAPVSSYASVGQLPVILSAAKCPRDGDKLNFVNLLGYVKFTLSQELADISEFFVSANADEILTGNRTRVDFSGKRPVLTLSELEENEYRWSYAHLCAFFGEPGDYYVAMYPGTYSEGLTFTFRKEDGKEASKSINQEVTLQPGYVQDIGTIKNLPEFTNPDDEIRAALIRFYKATGGDKWVNNEGWCSDKPIQEWYGLSGIGIGEIWLPSNNLTGEITAEIISEIENLFGLETLHVSRNSIKKIEIADNSRIVNLWCEENPLGSLTLDGLACLKSLNCDQCELSTLSLKGCVALEQLVCGKNKLTDLDLSDNVNLKSLVALDNFWETIDLSHCKQLETITLGTNNLNEGLRSIDVSSLPKLRKLLCTNCRFEQLDLSNNPELEELWCTVDHMSHLDLTHNLKLKHLLIGNKYPASYGMDGIAELDISNNKLLEELHVNYRNITSLDLRNNLKLATLDVSRTKLRDLKINHLSALEVLGCTDCEITSLDISENVLLYELSCNNNNISVLDLSNNINLKFIDCSKNDLRELDVSSSPLLYFLNCANNPNLKYVYANSNQNFECVKDGSTELVYNGSEVRPDEPYYESVDYSQDGRVVTIQRASVGAGIDIVLMGDGYSDRLIADGTYDDVMHRTMEVFFAEEPYKSFRDYFNVHYVTVVSQNEVFEEGASTALDSYFGDGTSIVGDTDKVLEYSVNVLDVDKMDDATVIVVLNSANYAGSCFMGMSNELAGDYANGLTVSFCPTAEDNATFAQIVQHEAGGHGFGKLGDEYTSWFAAEIPDWQIDGLMAMRAYGWYRNVDYVNDVSLVKWSHFLTDERYADEELGVYEGAYTYAYGVYRPSWNSIMRHNTGGFNAPSREAIYYRIHKLAYGPQWEYDYEEFVEYDAINRVAATKSAARNYVEKDDFVPLAPPVIIKGDWRDALK